jgi:2'-5' RNA ligase
VAWVRPENIHLSLAFLGNVPSDSVDALGAALDRAGRPVAPFSFDVEGIGTFGSRRSPRVIWAGAQGVPPLLTLQERVARALGTLGYEPDRKTFTPHLTIGRVRSARGREALLGALESVADASFGRVDVAHVRLMRSRLRPEGAEYSVLHETPLGGEP